MATSYDAASASKMRSSVSDILKESRVEELHAIYKVQKDGEEAAIQKLT